MALNPPQLADGTPTRLEGEYFVLNRKGIEFEVKIPNYGKKSGKGWLVLSTARLVLVNEKKSDLHAFDVPLAYMFGEKFHQPIFGANYYSATTKPLFANIISGNVPFKLWFMKGGCGKFLTAVKQVLAQIRENSRGRASAQFVERCSSGAFMQEMSYFDPNDPSTFYFTQPPVAAPVPSGAPAPGGPPVVGGAPPGVVGAPPAVVGAPPAVIGAPPAVVGAPPAVMGGPPTVVGAPPPMVAGGGPPMVIGGGPPPPGGAPGASFYSPPPGAPAGGIYQPPGGAYPPPGPGGAYPPPPGVVPGPPATGPMVYPGQGAVPPPDAGQGDARYYGVWGPRLE